MARGVSRQVRIDYLQRMRRHDLDWLRVIAFGLLIFYHVGMFFVPWGWHIKNEPTYDGLRYPMAFLNQWRLPLLFVVSGMGTWFAMAKRTNGQFAGERLRRLLLPLVFGILVIVPPQVYIERLDKGQFAGGYFSWWPMQVFRGVYPEGNFSWHHLWFIVYLLAFSLLLIPLMRLQRDKPDNALTGWLRRTMASPVGMYVFIIPLYLWESLLEPFFPSTHAFIGDWFNVINYMTLFFFGFLLMTVGDIFWTTVERHRRIFLVGGLIGFSANLLIWTSLEDSVPVHFIEAFVKVFNLWSWLLALFGYAARYLNRPGAFVSYANEAVYPFYILHQTIIVLLAWYLKPWSTGLGLKFTVLAGSTFLMTWLLYEGFIRRVPFLRPLFGLKAVASGKQDAG